MGKEPSRKRPRTDQDEVVTGKNGEVGDKVGVNLVEVSLGRSAVAKGAKQEKRLIVVLEHANLETVKSGKTFGLLNVDEHAGILRKFGRDFAKARPDITHQCLLMLLDSPLNRSGLLQVTAIVKQSNFINPRD